LIGIEVDPGYAKAQQKEELRRQIEARLRAMPDVQSVSRTLRAPLSNPAPDSYYALPGQTDRVGLSVLSYDFVPPDYLETLGVPLLSGRNFTEQEAKTGARVVVVSVEAARKIWPQYSDPGQVLGQTIGIEWGEINPAASLKGERPGPAKFPAFQVIGVARDTITGIIFEHQDPHVYLPLGASSQNGSEFLVRTRGDVNRVMGAIRAEIKQLDPDATLALKPTSELLEWQNTPIRMAAGVALALGLAALLLASIGLYGVMSFIVAQRTREIGIRVALGAQTGGILSLFLKQGMRLIGVGILLGLLGGAGMARLLSVALVNVSPFDPLSFAGVSLCLTLVALLATYLPARRATRVDPMVALRHE
jgi:putative ABC transport system permease protein